MKMVLRCIVSCASSSLHQKGQSGLKSVFWRKFRKRKAGATTTVKKKRLGGDNEEDEGDDGVGAVTAGAEVNAEVEAVKLTTVQQNQSQIRQKKNRKGGGGLKAVKVQDEPTAALPNSLLNPVSE